MDLAALDHRKHRRELPRYPRRCEPMKGLTLAQPKLLHAVLEQRRTAVLQVEPSLFHLRNVRHDPRFSPRAARQQRSELTPQLLVRDTAQLPECPCFHAQILTRHF